MASSSSAKKVARVAARSGSSSKGANSAKQRNWLFAVAIVVIVGLGVGVVAFARDRNTGLGDNDTPPRAQVVQGEAFDHWHAAFAMNVCGTELAPVAQVEPDPLGIHTHSDGLIHIHPFSVRAAGTGATMKRFFDQAGLDVTDDGFQTQDGEVYREGETMCGEDPGVLTISHWKDAQTAATREPDEVFTDNFEDIAFTEDLGAYTLSFKPEGTEVTAPASSAEIVTLGAQDGSATDPPVATGEPDVPVDDSSTTAASDTTPTTEAEGAG